MALSLVTGPTLEPLSLADTKAHLRVSLDDEDAYIGTLIAVARQRCEAATRRTLLTQTWDLMMDRWPTWDGYHGGTAVGSDYTALPAGGYIALPKPPLQSVSSVKYIDLAGNTQLWDPSNYDVEAPKGDRCARGRLALGWIKVWPIIRPTINAVQIRMVTGYGDVASDVPPILRQGMLLDIGSLYENRESILSGNRAASIEIVSTTREIYKSYRSL